MEQEHQEREMGGMLEGYLVEGKTWFWYLKL